MSIETKSVATLIDELMTASQRCFHAQDKILDMSLPESDRLKAAEVAQISNRRRSELMGAIDRALGDKREVLKKTY